LSNLFTKGEIIPDKTLSSMPLIGPFYRGISEKLESESEE